MIVVNRISKSFGQRRLWSNLSFTVERGEMLALTGPSGSGKSTLLNCLGLLEPVDTGVIRMDGHDITRQSSAAQRRFRRDTLGYLFQNYALIENASVDVNLEVAVGARRRDARRREAFEVALQAVGLGGRGQEPVYRLSGGEQQRLAVARLLVKRPRVVLADEPTGALDTDNAAVVIRLLRRLAEQGCAVVVATHSTHVESTCDTRLVVANSLLDPGPVAVADGIAHRRG
jgi:putative ABC transport system ATP-binding protein